MIFRALKDKSINKRVFPKFEYIHWNNVKKKHGLGFFSFYMEIKIIGLHKKWFGQVSLNIILLSKCI